MTPSLFVTLGSHSIPCPAPTLQICAGVSATAASPSSLPPSSTAKRAAFVVRYTRAHKRGESVVFLLLTEVTAEVKKASCRVMKVILEEKDPGWST